MAYYQQAYQPYPQQSYYGNQPLFVPQQQFSGQRGYGGRGRGRGRYGRGGNIIGQLASALSAIGGVKQQQQQNQNQQNQQNGGISKNQLKKLRRLQNQQNAGNGNAGNTSNNQGNGNGNGGQKLTKAQKKQAAQAKQEVKKGDSAKLREVYQNKNLLPLFYPHFRMISATDITPMVSSYCLQPIMSSGGKVQTAVVMTTVAITSEIFQNYAYGRKNELKDFPYLSLSEEVDGKMLAAAAAVATDMDDFEQKLRGLTQNQGIKLGPVAGGSRRGAETADD